MMENEKMDIDFIKWMCEKAEGFSYQEKFTIYGHYKEIRFVRNGWADSKSIEDSGSCTLYPLLLQRAIEGVNREANTKTDEDMGWGIEQEAWGLTAYKDFGGTISIYPFLKHDSEDKAKESALKYIYEQEKK